MKRQYKILPLQFPFDQEKEFWEDCVKYEIRPVFNRNGFYLDRKTNQTWLEIDGQAYLYSNRNYFQYNIDTSIGNNWMEDFVYKALNVIIKNHLANHTLRNKFIIEGDRRMLKQTYREARLFTRKILKEKI